MSQMKLIPLNIYKRIKGNNKYISRDLIQNEGKHVRKHKEL